MDSEKKMYIVVSIVLQTIAAYIIVSIVAVHYQGAFVATAAFRYYGIAFTCTESAKMFIEIGVFLGSLVMFFLSTTSSGGPIWLTFANIFLAGAFAIPIMMLINGSIINCW